MLNIRKTAILLCNSTVAVKFCEQCMIQNGCLKFLRFEGGFRSWVIDLKF